MLHEAGKAAEPDGLGAPAEARLTLTAVFQARRHEQAEQDRAAAALLPPVIALASHARVPIDVIGLVSRVSGVGEAQVQNGLFGMMAAGWVAILADGVGQPRITDNDEARAAANAPVIYFGNNAMPREELAYVVDAVAIAERAIAGVAATYPLPAPTEAATPAA